MADGPLKIDLHTHVLPRDWPDLRERCGYGGWPRIDHTGCGCARLMIDDELFREVHANCWDPRVRLDECDRAGVRVQVLSTVPVMFNYGARAPDTLCLARFLNDHIAGLCADHPDRFVGLGTVPMQDSVLAVVELERCVQELGLPGIQIGTHVNGWNLDEPALLPVFEAAAGLGAAVFVHPWEMLGRERMGRYWLPWLVGMPAETALAICSVIFGGVLERLPDLRIAFAHGGGAFPFTLGRIEQGYRVRPDLCAGRSSLGPRDLAGHLYVDSLVHDARALRYLLDTMGVERVALGSDYPFPLGEDEPGRLIESLGLPAADTDRLLCGSALEFLGLRREALTAAPPRAGSGPERGTGQPGRADSRPAMPRSSA